MAISRERETPEATSGDGEASPAGSDACRPVPTPCDAAADAPAPTADLRAGTTLAGRFTIEWKLGAGGMGHVYAAFDRVMQARVALKLLGSMNPTSSSQLKREFRAACEIVHPNLVRVHGLFVDGSDWFFTMDLVTGVPLPAFVQFSTRPLEQVVRRVFGQLAAALSVLHDAGTLHGDLKPSNFLVAKPDDRVVLLDFGLARPIGVGRAQDFAGTPGYAAPELFMDAPLTAAADWYSFGVVLYEALTGTLPFRSPSRQRLASSPPDLAELCLRLLSVHPGQRPSGDHVRAAFGLERRTPDAAGPPPSSARLLVGRAAELAQLQASLDATIPGRCGAVLVTGPSGIGKTSVVQRFVEHARARGSLVLTGRCRERESMSYKAIDGLLDDIVGAWNAAGETSGAGLSPADIADLTVLFPALRAAGAVPKDEPRPSAEDQGIVKRRAIGAFRSLLLGFARGRALVLWIDDLQWSDTESALLLGPLLGDTGGCPVLFIGAYRSTHGTRGLLLDALEKDGTLGRTNLLELSLGPLPVPDAERLVRDRLPPEHPHAADVARTIARDAGGHPLFAVELAHAAGSESAAPTSVATTLSELVTRRIRSLPPDTRDLLAAAAIAGAPLPRSVLRGAQGMTVSGAEQAIDLLRANRLAKSHGSRADDAVEIAHDRIREIVLAGVSPADRERHHRRLARQLQDRPDCKPDVVAAHFQGAGELAQAGHYWATAAEQAHRALAFARAVELYDAALRHARLDDERRSALGLRRAEALAQGGRGPESADAYLELAAGAASPTALDLRRRASEQLLLSGHFERGLAVIEPVLRVVGLREPRSGRSALASAALGRALVRLRGLRHARREEREVPLEDLARLDACWTIASSLSLLDPIRGADFQSRHLRLALRAGEPRRLLRALSLEVSYAATPGLGSERRTADLLALATDLVAESHDFAAVGLLDLARGISAYLEGRIAAALSHCEGALRIFQERCAGAVWETMSAQRFVIVSLFLLGKLRRLSEFVPPILAGAEGTGNLYATMCFRSAFSTLAWLTRDDVDETERQLRRAEQEGQTAGSMLTRYNLLIGRTYLDLYTGDVERAGARLLEWWKRLQTAQLLRIGVIRVQLFHMRAACHASVADRLDGRGQRARAQELRRDARAMTARLRRERIARARPLAGLVDAALDLSRGERRGAERHLRACQQDFESFGLSLFAAATRVRLGELIGGGEGASLGESGWTELRREGVVDPNRMLDLLAPGFAPGRPGRP